MKVHLLIQRTFSGLNTEYTTSPAIAKLDTKLFLTDERNMAMQLTDAPFFSLAKNEQWVAYSFIRPRETCWFLCYTPFFIASLSAY